MFPLAVIISCAGALLRQKLLGQQSSITGLVSWFLLLLTLQLPCVIAWKLAIYPYYFSPLRKLPRALQSHSWRSLFYEPTSDDFLMWMQSVPNDGLIRYLGLLNSERVLVTSPDGLSELLQTKPYHFIKTPAVRRILLMILGDGLIVAEGSEHKFQRKNLTPAFSFRKVKDLYPVFWSKAREYCLKLDEEVRESSGKGQDPTAIVDITEWNQRVSLDIISLAGFGEDARILQDANSEWYQNYRVAFLPSKQARRLRLLAIFLPGPLLACLPMKRVKDVRHAEDAVKSHLRGIIAAKQASHTRGENKDDSDMISQAINTGAFSEANLLDQSMTLLAAGHETTSSALSFAAYALSQHPGIQSRLREEVRSMLPSPCEDAVMSSEVLDALSYLPAVCNEVLRLYSPVPQVQRTALVDTTLEGVAIPKGTHVRASSWAGSKSTHLWGESAQEFVPERWIEGDKSSKGGADSHYSYMAFSQGARSCIGASFAKAEFAACLACLVGRFDIKLERVSRDGDLEVEHGITAKIDGGLLVRLSSIDGW